MTTERRLARAGFTLTRDYPVSPDRVWAAFAEEDQKLDWFGAGDAFEPGECAVAPAATRLDSPVRPPTHTWVRGSS